MATTATAAAWQQRLGRAESLPPMDANGADGVGLGVPIIEKQTQVNNYIIIRVFTVCYHFTGD